MKKTIALAGNPNSGKTTVFNHLAGAREKVGNWPGTTVERKEGLFIRAGRKIVVVDLPGVYGLNAYSMDEKVARDYLVREHPALVVAVVDASNLERHLYLVAQLLEMGQNTVICLNKMDLAREHGLEINVEELAGILQVPVVEAAAIHGRGMEQLKDTIVGHLEREPIPLQINYGDLEPDIACLVEFFNKNDMRIVMNPRAVALRVSQEDQDIFDKMRRDARFTDVRNILRDIQARRAMNREIWIREKKYAFIKGVVTECTRRYLTLDERVTISDKIDRIVTHRFLGVPVFLGFMYLLFSLVFKVGDPFVGFIHKIFFALVEMMCVGFIQGTMGALQLLINDTIRIAGPYLI